MKAWILLLILKAAAYTPKEGNVTATLGPFFYKTNFNSPPPGAKSPLMGGFGIMALGDIDDRGSLEIAIIHMNKLFFREQAGIFIGEKTQTMHVTMGYRRWWDNGWSGSLTFYSAYAMGDPQVVHNEFAAGTEVVTSARDITEHGFDFALQRDLWTFGSQTLVMDARYSRSVTAKDHEKADHYGVMLALRHLVQEKR